MAHLHAPSEKTLKELPRPTRSRVDRYRLADGLVIRSQATTTSGNKPARCTTLPGDDARSAPRAAQADSLSAPRRSGRPRAASSEHGDPRWTGARSPASSAVGSPSSRTPPPRVSPRPPNPATVRPVARPTSSTVPYRQEDPPPLVDAAGNTCSTVEELVVHRDLSRASRRSILAARHYRDRWLGYPPEVDMWEPRARHLLDVPCLVVAYKNLHRAPSWTGRGHDRAAPVPLVNAFGSTDADTPARNRARAAVAPHDIHYLAAGMHTHDRALQVADNCQPRECACPSGADPAARTARVVSHTNSAALPRVGISAGVRLAASRARVDHHPSPTVPPRGDSPAGARPAAILDLGVRALVTPEVEPSLLVERGLGDNVDLLIVRWLAGGVATVNATFKSVGEARAARRPRRVVDRETRGAGAAPTVARFFMLKIRAETTAELLWVPAVHERAPRIRQHSSVDVVHTVSMRHTKAGEELAHFIIGQWSIGAHKLAAAPAARSLRPALGGGRPKSEARAGIVAGATDTSVLAPTLPLIDAVHVPELAVCCELAVIAVVAACSTVVHEASAREPAASVKLVAATFAVNAGVSAVLVVAAAFAAIAPAFAALIVAVAFAVFATASVVFVYATLVVVAAASAAATGAASSSSRSITTSAVFN
ncbi:hypothetical protein PybrP1_000371 [[Pythium] brassicae (nom. inval.)]|nr:hypothetical protein PybrP1_000371 [[Pythium] brassicae (nom. inval.)]